MLVHELIKKLKKMPYAQEVTVQTLSNSAKDDGYLGEVIDVAQDEEGVFLTVFVEE